MNRLYIYALVGILILPVFGQFLRLPYAGGGILFSDAVIPVFIVVLLADKWKELKKQINYKLFLVFLVITVLGLINGSRVLLRREAIISLFYLIRLLSYMFLFFAVTMFAEKKKNFSIILHTIYITGALVAVLGFFQMYYFPDFQVLGMDIYGWDPHKGRLLSTWFDPNFTGAFFVLNISLILGVMLGAEESRRKKMFSFFLLIIFILALILTFSRSSYLALIVSLVVFGLLKTKKIFVLSILFLVLVFVFVSPRAKNRIREFSSSVKAVAGADYFTLDPTARFRAVSWSQTFSLAKEHPFIGVGYNSLRFVNYHKGSKEALSHASSGSDSSLLTILATTGGIGLTLFLTLVISILRHSFLRIRKKNIFSLKQGVCLGFFAGTAGLFVHSLFVNSLLFPFIMIYYWTVAGLVSSND